MPIWVMQWFICLPEYWSEPCVWTVLLKTQHSKGSLELPSARADVMGNLRSFEASPMSRSWLPTKLETLPSPAGPGGDRPSRSGMVSSPLSACALALSEIPVEDGRWLYFTSLTSVWWPFHHMMPLLWDMWVLDFTSVSLTWDSESYWSLESRFGCPGVAALPFHMSSILSLLEYLGSQTAWGCSVLA